jgi:pyruvate kinase
MIDAGMDIARLNFSHGDYETHQRCIDLLREVQKEKKSNLGIMLDTKGPEIRVHNFSDGQATINKGEVFKIYSDEILGDSKQFSVNYSNFYKIAKPNQLVKIDDGKFVAKILSLDPADRSVECKAITSLTLKNHKGVNVVGARLDMPFISEKDKKDIEFGCKNNLNFVAASFVRRADDVIELKNLLKEFGHEEVLVISKIESCEAISKIKEIVHYSDAIMVARGDLGVEIAPEKVPIVQIELIEECRKVGKPVIIATQMLESMQHSILPTRAEVNDVALGIFQGTDCVMLSGESASGEYPVESTLMQKKIALEVEEKIDYSTILSTQNIFKNSSEDALANAAALAALNSKAKLIVVFDDEGTICQRISNNKPIAPVVCVTSSLSLTQRLSLYWGLYGYQIPKEDVENSDVKFLYLRKICKEFGVPNGSKVLLIRSKHSSGYDLREESIRIIGLN